MDLVTLLEHVPPLGEACVNDKTDALRTLRLVSKEASRVALQSLRSYSLTLTGHAFSPDTNVGGAGLLRGTQLTRLSVQLRLTGSYNPADLLELFVEEVGTALSTVTMLDLDFQPSSTPHDDIRRAVLDTAIAMLFEACPALTFLRSDERLSSLLLGRLNQVCPYLSYISINVRDCSQEETRCVVDQLNSLLPQVISLSLPNLDRHIPDMSRNSHILELDLVFDEFKTESDWLCLPPKRQILRCGHIAVGPQSTPDRTPLGSLLSIDFPLSGSVALDGLALVLRAAPALRLLQANSRHPERPLGISCALNGRTSADLQLLFEKHKHTDMVSETIKHARYVFFCSEEERAGLDMHTFFSTLPRMTGILNCRLHCLKAGELGQLVGVFPDVKRLALYDSASLGDIELQEVASCAQITRLELCECDKVSPMGLLWLCHRLPKLSTVRCVGCSQLKGPALETCVKLLGRDITIEDVPVSEDDEDSDGTMSSDED